MNKNIILIGIAGGTGSGKTTIAKNIINKLSSFNLNIALIEQDSYYKDLSNINIKEREKINFDHPNSIDFKLMYNHILDLSNSNNIQMPLYDYITHTRKNKTKLIKKSNIIIVEGIFALYDPKIRDILNMKIYIDTDDDIRIIRRITRDIEERKRTLLSITNQYLNSVKPMHELYVKSTKMFADFIISGNSINDTNINHVCKNINYLYKK